MKRSATSAHTLWTYEPPCAVVCLACLVFAVLPAEAAPASRKDFEDFTQSLLTSRIHSNPRLVLEHCEEARAKAARFDRNAGWQGLVMDCFGHVEAIHSRKEAACTYFATAIDFFKKARPHAYEVRWVRDGLQRTTRYRASLGC